MDLGRAIKEGVLSGESVLVYDPRIGKRVTLTTALSKGMVDRMTGEYIDRNTGLRTEAKDAAKMGLMAVIGRWSLWSVSQKWREKHLLPPFSSSISSSCSAIEN